MHKIGKGAKGLAIKLYGLFGAKVVKKPTSIKPAGKK